MKQLLILSGKGGTGKTTVAGAFIHLSQAEAFADCDVDAPNLHLISSWENPPKHSDYFGMPLAHIDTDACINCGICLAHCRFDAIEDEPFYQVKPFACEGCGVCVFVCPAQAVSLQASRAGELTLYKDEKRVFSTAKLNMGSGTSGKLVTEVKKQMKAEAQDVNFAIIDGSPGIGCPVIASVTGVDTALIVTEPSLSGFSDMERILKTAEHLRVKVAVCVNKADTNPDKAEDIRVFCEREEIPFVGTIPFDPEAVQAINSGKSIVELDCPSGRAVRDIYKNLRALMFEETEAV